jgi:hypothetical protein
MYQLTVTGKKHIMVNGNEVPITEETDSGTLKTENMRSRGVVG